jgi:integrase/recombinase XerD
VSCIIDNKIVLLRAPEGCLAAHIGPFARTLSKQGYALDSVHRQVLLAACFSRWLNRQGVPLRSISSEHPSGYLRYRARQVRPHQGDSAALMRLLSFLPSEGVIRAEKISAQPQTAVERCWLAYERHLREARGLANEPILNYVPFVRSFLMDRFGDGPVALPQLSALDVVRFVQRQAPRLHPLRAKVLTCALRSFLQYVRYRGKAKLDLAAAVPAVAYWSMAAIPRAIAADQVRQLLASIDRRTAMGLATTPSCSCLHDWVCVPVKWRRSNSKTLTGTWDSCVFTAKVASVANYHCPRKLAKRLPRICSVDDRNLPPDAYSCARGLPCAAF